MRNLLLEAKREIEQLRRRNELLEARNEVVSIFGAALLGPRPPQGFSPDVAWALQKAADEFATPPAQGPVPESLV